MSARRNHPRNRNIEAAVLGLVINAAWWLITSVGHHFTITWR